MALILHVQTRKFWLWTYLDCRAARTSNLDVSCLQTDVNWIKCSLTTAYQVEWLQCVRWRQKWEHFRTLRSEIFRATIRFIPLITDSGGSIVQKRINAAEDSDFWLFLRSLTLIVIILILFLLIHSFLVIILTFFLKNLTFSSNSEIFLQKIWLCFSKLWLVIKSLTFVLKFKFLPSIFFLFSSKSL